MTALDEVEGALTILERHIAFTYNTAHRFDTLDECCKFVTEELTQRVTALYGVRPSVEFVEIAALVENATTKT